MALRLVHILVVLVIDLQYVEHPRPNDLEEQATMNFDVVNLQSSPLFITK